MEYVLDCGVDCEDLEYFIEEYIIENSNTDIISNQEFIEGINYIQKNLYKNELLKMVCHCSSYDFIMDYIEDYCQDYITINNDWRKLELFEYLDKIKIALNNYEKMIDEEFYDNEK